MNVSKEYNIVLLIFIFVMMILSVWKCGNEQMTGVYQRGNGNLVIRSQRICGRNLVAFDCLATDEVTQGISNTIHYQEHLIKEANKGFVQDIYLLLQGVILLFLSYIAPRVYLVVFSEKGFRRSPIIYFIHRAHAQMYYVQTSIL